MPPTQSDTDRYCDWWAKHPPTVERVAKELDRRARGSRRKPTVAAGCYLREACAAMHPEGCPHA